MNFELPPVSLFLSDFFLEKSEEFLKNFEGNYLIKPQVPWTPQTLVFRGTVPGQKPLLNFYYFSI